MEKGWWNAVFDVLLVKRANNTIRLSSVNLEASTKYENVLLKTCEVFSSISSLLLSAIKILFQLSDMLEHIGCIENNTQLLLVFHRLYSLKGPSLKNTSFTYDWALMVSQLLFHINNAWENGSGLVEFDF